MTRTLSPAARAQLPPPLHGAEFTHLRTGIFDDPDIAVFVDADGSYAVLDPRPEFDYANYKPRSQTLALAAYKKTLDVATRRFAKVGDAFPAHGTVLEAGAADGAFLTQLLAQRPALRAIAVEPDRATAEARAAMPLAGDFASLDEAVAADVRADIVCLFHVFEHIDAPQSYIEQMKALLAPGGRIVIEVPVLTDPLLSVYHCAAYEAFYFQRQHPQVYSGASLKAVLEAAGLRVVEIRPYQRYGLENHLAWLKNGKPGGDAEVAELVADIDGPYRARLEAAGLTDTVFAIAEVP